jgi:hypothetical protein
VSPVAGTHAVALLACLSACTTPAAPSDTVGQSESESAAPRARSSLRSDAAAFSVLESAEADELFAATLTCRNEDGGYTLRYPASWETNEAGERPACSWFSPADLARGHDTVLAAFRRPTAAIEVGSFHGGVGIILEQPRVTEEIILAGSVEATRTERMISPEPHWVSYDYLAWLDDDPHSWKFGAGTSTIAPGDYELNKAVLDRMMATIAFDAPPDD